MRRLAFITLILWSVSPLSATAQARAAPPRPFHLAIDAAVLAGLPRRTLSATDERGNTASYSGVSLHDLLVRAGAPTGQAVRGTAMLSYIVVGAADGYHVLFALPELDPSFGDHLAVIADQKDGVALGSDAGPYRLITNFDKRDARWVRQVTEVWLVNAPVP